MTLRCHFGSKVVVGLAYLDNADRSGVKFKYLTHFLPFSHSYISYIAIMPSALLRIVVCLAAFSWPSYIPSEVDVGHSSVNGTAVDTTLVHDDRTTVEDISLPTPCVGDTCTIRGRFTCPPPRDRFLAAAIYIYHLRRRNPRLLSQSAVFLLSVLFDTTPGKGIFRIILYAIFICKVTVLVPSIFVK